MNPDWLTKYPRAAAMLQGDDDVLDYAPQSAHGLEDPDGIDDAAALAAYRRAFGEDPPAGPVAPDGVVVTRQADGRYHASYQAAPSALAADQAYRLWVLEDQPTAAQALQGLRAILRQEGVVPGREDAAPHGPQEEEPDRGDW